MVFRIAAASGRVTFAGGGRDGVSESVAGACRRGMGGPGFRGLSKKCLTIWIERYDFAVEFITEGKSGLLDPKSGPLDPKSGLLDHKSSSLD